MSAEEDRYPAVGELPALIQKVLDDPDTTKSVASHVRWVHRTLRLALEQEDFKKRYGKSMRDLLGPGATALCHMTENGELRVREGKTDPKGVTASQRRRSSVLRRLALAAGVPSGAVSYPKPPRKPTMPPWARSALHNGLKKEVERRPSAPGTARLHVVVGLVLDTALRTGELCSCGIADLAPDLSWVKITRNPQAIPSDLHVTEVWPVSPVTQAALENWLPLRDRLITNLQGSRTALLVAHGHGGYRRGTPLGRKGLIESYVAQVQELKTAVSSRGGKGWELPEGLEQLRRGVDERRSDYDAGREAGAKTPEWGPAVTLSPMPGHADQERKRTAAAFAKTATAVESFHQARQAVDDETDAQVLRARQTLRKATRTAWAHSDHATTLKLLRQAGLSSEDLAAAGYSKLLLDALERS
ncbi:hypothetical protein P1P68_02405 [Streptomyces scabiei]|uniref:hypothetical protein n=1 Tax=Streptomyces scabiei TaxID=1930 RepID=UPI00299023D3|nr:hypothetical protein [Streptomyces scabiei]MDW8803687.1 hypothetical protein [Streptomyces scabiei]